MKTEEQIKKKYKEMLEHTKLLTDVHNIQEHIRNANEQFSMNSLIEWVLDIKK
jgi:heme oxygenase